MRCLEPDSGYSVVMTTENEPLAPDPQLLEERLQLVEETLRIDKRRVETGTVRVRTIVDEAPVTLNETLTHERVEAVHVPIGRVVDVVPPLREDDGVTIISVVEERVRIVRELVLVEELHLRRVRSEEPYVHTTTRRVMRAVVERTPVDPSQSEN